MSKIPVSDSSKAKANITTPNNSGDNNALTPESIKEAMVKALNEVADKRKKDKNSKNDGETKSEKELSTLYRNFKATADKLTTNPAQSLEKFSHQVLPREDAHRNVKTAGLEALIPGMGLTTMLMNGVGLDPVKMAAKTADFGWNRGKALFKGVRNKVLGRKWGENNSTSIFSTGSGSSKLSNKGATGGAIDKARANAGIPGLIKVTKKGFNDVVKQLKRISGTGSGEEKKKSNFMTWILAALAFLRAKLKSLFGGLLNNVLGRGLTRNLSKFLGKGLGNVFNKLTGNVFKRGLLRSIPRLGAKMFGSAGAKVGARLLPAAGIGLAAGYGTKWIAKKLGANDNQAAGFGKVAGMGAAGAKIGMAFGPVGALIGAGVGAVAGALWHGASELNRVNKEYKKAGQALKKYTEEEIRAGKAVGDKNVPTVSNGAWSRSLGWLGSRWSKESRENYRKVEAQRLAVNEADKKHFEEAKYGSVADLDKDSERIKATLSNKGWFSKSSKQSRDAALKAMSGSVLDYIDKADDKKAAMKEMKEKYGLSSRDIRQMRNPDKYKEDFGGQNFLKAVIPGYGLVDSVKKGVQGVQDGSYKQSKMYQWFTKHFRKNKEDEETTKNTDALTKLTEILTQMTNPDGLESKGKRGNTEMSPVPSQGGQMTVVNAAPAPAASPIPLAGITQ